MGVEPDYFSVGARRDKIPNRWLDVEWLAFFSSSLKSLEIRRTWNRFARDARDPCVRTGTHQLLPDDRIETLHHLLP
jgi:hypothetical protein